MDDFSYFEMHVRQEKEASRTAKSSHARESHEELAAAYEIRCSILRDQMKSAQELRVQEAFESQTF